MNFVLKPITLIAIIFTCCLTYVQGQQRCYLFDDFEPNSRISSDQDDLPSTLFGSEFGMNVSAELFTNQNGGFYFRELTTVDESAEPHFIHGQNLSISLKNIAAKFDFSETGFRHHLVQFHGFNSGGGFNLSVNSEVSRYFSSLSEISNFPYPEVTFEAIEIPNESGDGSFFVATLISNEPIESVTIGAENIILDNICYSPTLDPECRIYNPMNVPVCVSEDSLSVDLYLNHTLANPSILIRLNGVEIGKREIVDNKIELRSIAQLDQLPDELNFELNSVDQDCWWNFTTQKPSCTPPSNDCEITNPQLELSLCDENGDFYAHLNFDTLNVNDSFYVRINSDFFEKFPYSSNPLTLRFNDSLSWVNADNLDWTVQIGDVENTQCFNQFSVDGNTLCGRNCNFENLLIEDVICQQSFDSLFISFHFDTPVSYTHLTLPTICSV